MSGGPLDDLGLHFLLGLAGQPRLGPRDRDLLARLRPAGVILYRGNFRHDLPYQGWLDELDALLGEVRVAIDRPSILVAIDHEGGTVHRPPPPLTRYGFARQWRAQAADVGDAMAVALAAICVNLSFAPVGDLDTNPANPVIGPRAFGAEVDEVIDAARRFSAAMHAAGVWTCLKHFPGHGDTSVDSHEALPSLDLDLATLRRRELAPYRALVGGAPMVMTAHILFPQLDPRTPATMSRRILTGLLREELGYQGVVTTDDVGMKAMASRLGDPAFAGQVLAAGCDQIMVCDYWTRSERALDLAAGIAAAHASGAVSDEVLVASQARVSALLARTPRHQVRALPAEHLVAHAARAPLHHATAGTDRAGQTVALRDG